jgi:hypothetical protein
MCTVAKMHADAIQQKVANKEAQRAKTTQPPLPLPLAHVFQLSGHWCTEAKSIMGSAWLPMKSCPALEAQSAGRAGQDRQAQAGRQARQAGRQAGQAEWWAQTVVKYREHDARPGG